MLSTDNEGISLEVSLMVSESEIDKKKFVPKSYIDWKNNKDTVSPIESSNLILWRDKSREVWQSL